MDRLALERQVYGKCSVHGIPIFQLTWLQPGTSAKTGNPTGKAISTKQARGNQREFIEQQIFQRERQTRDKDV